MVVDWWVKIYIVILMGGWVHLSGWLDEYMDWIFIHFIDLCLPRYHDLIAKTYILSFNLHVTTPCCDTTSVKANMKLQLGSRVARICS